MNKLLELAVEIKKERDELQKSAQELQAKAEALKVKEKQAFGVCDGENISIPDIIELIAKVAQA